MNNASRALTVSLICLTGTVCAFGADVPNILWYRQPAQSWTDALPIGNGRLGAMVYGKVDTELLSLNEETLYSGEIHFLPVLPAAWPTGYVRGLRARGGFELDIAWKDGKLTKGDIRAKHTGTCKLRYGQKKLEIKTHAGRTYSFNGSLQQM